MLLAIDSGNTNAVFALYRGKEMVGKWRAATDPKRTADEYAVWLSALLALNGLSLKEVTGCIMANVVPSTMFALKSFCRKYCGHEALVVEEPNVKVTIPIRIDRPGQVGGDRIADAVAAHALIPGASLVIDFGTATTFNLVASDGGFEGAVICPGINTSMEALHLAAARLPRFEIVKTTTVIGKATVPAMQAGLYWGYVGMIEGLVARMKAEFGQPLTVLATGGLAPLFADATKAIDKVVPDLTLEGLRLIYEANR